MISYSFIIPSFGQTVGRFYSGSSNSRNETLGNYYVGSPTQVYEIKQTDYNQLEAIAQQRAAKQYNDLKITQSYIDYCQDLKRKVNGLNDPEINLEIDKLIEKMENLITIIEKNFSIDPSTYTYFDNSINSIIRNYNDKIYINKQRVEAYNLGLEYYKKGNFSSAISKFNEAYIDIRLRLHCAYFLSISHFRKNDFNIGVKYFEEAKKSGISMYFPYYYGGWCLWNNGMYEKSLEFFGYCVEIDPDSYLSFYSRGSALSNLNRKEEAISDYKKAVQLSPDFSMGYNNIAWTYYELNNLKLALSYANIAIEKDPENYTAWDTRADIKLKLFDYKGAISDATKALELNSGLSNSLIILAKSNFKLGYKTKSCEYLVKASALNNQDADKLIKIYNCGF